MARTISRKKVHGEQDNKREALCIKRGSGGACMAWSPGFHHETGCRGLSTSNPNCRTLRFESQSVQLNSLVTPANRSFVHRERVVPARERDLQTSRNVRWRETPIGPDAARRQPALAHPFPIVTHPHASRTPQPYKPHSTIARRQVRPLAGHRQNSESNGSERKRYEAKSAQLAVR